MFKHYLTLHFAQAFLRDCNALELFHPKKQELLRCAQLMLQALTRGLQRSPSAKTAPQLFTAIAYLRDCQDILQTEKIKDDGLNCRFYILQGRLEQLFWDSSKSEENQLRMLG